MAEGLSVSPIVSVSVYGGFMCLFVLSAVTSVMCSIFCAVTSESSLLFQSVSTLPPLLSLVNTNSLLYLPIH